FVRVTNKGPAGYRTWKSVRRMHREHVGTSEKGKERERLLAGRMCPQVFVSVAAKGLTRALCRRESNRLDGKILEELEGLRGGGAWFAGHREIVPNLRNYYSTLV